MERERDVEAWMRREVEKLDGMFVKLTSPSRDGMPDRMVILPGGRIVFVELKTVRGILSRIQEWQIGALRKRGVQVCVVYGRRGAEDMMEDLWSGRRLEWVYK